MSSVNRPKSSERAWTLVQKEIFVTGQKAFHVNDVRPRREAELLLRVDWYGYPGISSVTYSRVLNPQRRNYCSRHVNQHLLGSLMVYEGQTRSGYRVMGPRNWMGSEQTHTDYLYYSVILHHNCLEICGERNNGTKQTKTTLRLLRVNVRNCFRGIYGRAKDVGPNLNLGNRLYLHELQREVDRARLGHKTEES